MMRKYLKKIKLFLVMGVLLSVITLIKFIHYYSSYNGLFSDYKIKINGIEYIERITIKNKLYPQINSSIINLNLSEIQTKLKEIEYVETVQVSQILPKLLIINIVERTPIIIINKNDKSIFMDKNELLLTVNEKSITTFPVPVLSILDDSINIQDNKNHISNVFKFILSEYPEFYQNLSEIFIKSDSWEFHSDHKTKIITQNNNLKNQLIILKEFEKTVFPIRDLNDYNYIDLRIKDQIIVKERFHKG